MEISSNLVAFSKNTNFNRPKKQIKLHLTSWQYPFINHLGPNIAACSSPLKPTGHCCYNICGAIIYIQKPWDAIDVPFNLIEAKNDMEALINPPPPRKGFSFKSKSFEFWHIQGVPTQTCTLHFALAGRNMQVRFCLQVVWHSMARANLKKCLAGDKYHRSIKVHT